MTVARQTREQRNDMEYWAFVSYSHKDARHAKRLHSYLEGYRLPRRLVNSSTRFGTVPRRLYPVFIDREEFPASADLGAAVQAGLARSRVLIVVCSPSAASSRWVNEEIVQFRQLHGPGRILPLIVSGEPNAATLGAATGGAECFPPALCARFEKDGSPAKRVLEPIAADVRPGMDGWNSAMLKLVAGITGVKLEELRRRETVRRRRRQVGAATALLAMCLLGAGLWTVVNERARRQVEDQKALQAAERSLENARVALLEGDSLQAAHLFVDSQSLRERDDPRVSLGLGISTRNLVGLRRVFRGHGAEVTSLQLDPTGRFLVSVAGTRGARLWRLADGTLLHQLGGDVQETWPMPNVIFRPDGRWLAYSTADEAYALEIESGRRVPPFVDPVEGPPMGLTFAEDGSVLIGSVAWIDSEGKHHSKLTAYDAESGELLWHWQYPGLLSLLALDEESSRAILYGDPRERPSRPYSDPRDGMLPALESHEMKLLSIDWRSGVVVHDRALTEHFSVTVSPNHRLALIDNDDARFEIVDLVSLATVSVLDDDIQPLRVRWSSTGKNLLSLDRGPTVSIWDASSGHRTYSLSLSDTQAAALDPSGSIVAVADSRGIISIWDVRADRVIATIFDRIDDAGRGVFSIPDSALRFSRGGDRLYYSGHSVSIKEWELSALPPFPQKLAGHEGGIRSVRFSEDDLRLVTTGEDNVARVWDLSSGATIVTAQGPPEYGEAPTLTGALLTPDGRHFVTAGAFNDARAWTLRTGTLAKTLELDKPGFVVMDEVLLGVNSATDRLFTLSRFTGAGAVWNGSSLERVTEFRTRVARDILSARYSVDGSKIVGIASDGSIFSIDVRNRDEKKVPLLTTQHILATAISDDGRKAGYSAVDGTLRVLDVIEGAVLLSVPAGHSPQFALCFDGPGQRLATAGAEDVVRVWELANGAQQLVLEEEEPGGSLIELDSGGAFEFPEGEIAWSGFLSVQFSPDGALIAAGSHTGDVSIWDVSTGSQIVRVHFPGNPSVDVLRFSASGRRLAAGTKSGDLQVWELPRESRATEAIRSSLETY